MHWLSSRGPLKVQFSKSNVESIQKQVMDHFAVFSCIGVAIHQVIVITCFSFEPFVCFDAIIYLVTSNFVLYACSLFICFLSLFLVNERKG